MKNQMFTRYMQPVPAALVCFCAAMLAKAWSNQTNFQNDCGDLAIFTQAYFNTLHGQWMFNSFEGSNHLAVHFSPLLLLFTPLMALTHSTRLLMALNTVSVALACLLLYRHLAPKRPVVAILMTVLLLCHVTLYRDSFYSFHELSLLPLPFMATFIAYREQRWWSFMAWLLVMACIRENLYLTLFAWSAICWVTGRDRRWVLGAASLAALHLLVVSWLVPWYFGGSHTPSLLNHFRGYGSDLPSIITNLSAHPSLPFETLTQPTKLHYLRKLLTPFLFVLPFMSRWWLPALPTLLIVLFATHGRLDDPSMHYSIEVVLWFAVSTLYFLEDRGRLEQARWLPLARTATWILCLYMALNCANSIRKAHAGLESTRYQAFTRIAELIPAEASLGTTRILANHLAWRPRLEFMLELHESQRWSAVDYLLIEGERPADVPVAFRAIAETGPFKLFIRDPMGSTPNPTASP